MELRRILLCCVIILSAACGSSSSPYTSPTPTPTPTPTPSGTAVSIPVGARSSSGMAGFAPNPITVAVGAAVTWTNNDSIAHDVTSDTGVWNSNSMAPGAQFTFTFQTKGAFPYHCAVHPGMVGTVNVQ